MSLKTLTVQRIGVFSLAKLQALIMAVIGLIIGILTAIAASVLSGGANQNWVTDLGFAAIIVLPLVYAVLGFIAGGIGALIYNLAAAWMGGISISVFETTIVVAPPPAPTIPAPSPVPPAPAA